MNGRLKQPESKDAQAIPYKPPFLYADRRQRRTFFDVHEILLETDQGMLMIKGDDLHVNRLTLEKGEVDIDGKIDSFTYSEAALSSGKGESFFAKLFK